MKVLVACEFSGIVRDAFAERGHFAVSCDLLPSERPGLHRQMDVLELLSHDNDWDLMIAHPPCTRLCNSGVSWLNKRNLWGEMLDAGLFFKGLLESSVARIAIENPIPHKYAVEVIKRKYDQIVQPWMFGHGETKATCLWLKNLPKLQSTNVVEGRKQRSHWESPGPDRWKRRSRTYTGIANAMAEQWGCLA